MSLAELREECARVRAAADPDPEATNRRLHAGRRLRRWTDGEGFWNLHAKGSPQAGALFNTVLDPIIDRIFKTASRAGRREHPDAYAFDALIHLAEHAAGHCDRDHPTQPARDAGDNRADAAAGNGGPAGHADADWGDPTGRDATDADTAEAARADAAGADCGGTDAGADADAGFSGAASRGAATPTGERAAVSAAWTDPGTAGTNRSANAGVPSGGADSDDRPGSALAVGDPGIFAANAGATGSVGRTESRSGCAVRPSTNPRYLALLRVDAQALRRGHVRGEELCEIAGVGPVPVSVAKDLLGEAILKLVITDGVDVANVTHLGRGPTAAQRAALLWANPTCSVQGCPRRRIEYDHQKPWAQTKHTRLDELDPLCGFHHDLKTRLGYALVAGKGKRAFVAPDDPRHPRYREPSGNRSRSGDAGEPTEARRNSRGGAASASDRSAAAAEPNGRSGRQRPGSVRDGDGIRRPRDTRRAQSAGQPEPGLFTEPRPP